MSKITAIKDLIIALECFKVEMNNKDVSEASDITIHQLALLLTDPDCISKLEMLADGFRVYMIERIRPSGKIMTWDLNAYSIESIETCLDGVHYQLSNGQCFKRSDIGVSVFLTPEDAREWARKQYRKTTSKKNETFKVGDYVYLTNTWYDYRRAKDFMGEVEDRMIRAYLSGGVVCNKVVQVQESQDGLLHYNTKHNSFSQKDIGISAFTSEEAAVDYLLEKLKKRR